MNTTQKIILEVDKLENVWEDLSDILSKAGQDSETEYTKVYLDMLWEMKDLNNGLHALLDRHDDIIVDLNYNRDEPKPVRSSGIQNQPALDAICDNLPSEGEMQKGKITFMPTMEDIDNVVRWKK